MAVPSRPHAHPRSHTRPRPHTRGPHTRPRHWLRLAAPSTWPHHLLPHHLLPHHLLPHHLHTAGDRQPSLSTTQCPRYFAGGGPPALALTTAAVSAAAAPRRTLMAAAAAGVTGTAASVTGTPPIKRASQAVVAHGRIHVPPTPPPLSLRPLPAATALTALTNRAGLLAKPPRLTAASTRRLRSRRRAPRRSHRRLFSTFHSPDQASPPTPPPPSLRPLPAATALTALTNRADLLAKPPLLTAVPTRTLRSRRRYHRPPQTTTDHHRPPQTTSGGATTNASAAEPAASAGGDGTDGAHQSRGPARQVSAADGSADPHDAISQTCAMTSPPPLLLDVPLTAADSNSTTKTADSSGADAPADAPSTHHESRQFPAGGGAATHDCQPTPSPDGDSGSAHATVDTVPPPDATAADLAAKPATPASGSDTDDAHLTRRATCQPFTDGSTATRDCGPLPAPGIDGSSEHPLGTSHEVGVSSESSTAIFATTDRLATGTDGISDASPAAAGAVQPLSTSGQASRQHGVRSAHGGCRLTNSR